MLLAGATSAMVAFAFSRGGSGLPLATFASRAKAAAFGAAREGLGTASAATDAFSATAARDEEEVIAAMFRKLIGTGRVALAATR